MSKITYDSAIFVTDGESLISIKDDRNFDWVKFSWITDRDFLCVLSQVLTKKRSPKIIMSNGCEQIAREWAATDQFLFTYHEWVAISQNFIRDYPLCKGTDEFSIFYRYGTEHSKEKIRELIEALTGLFKIIDGEIFIIFTTSKPVWGGNTSSLENLHNFWMSLPTLDEIIKAKK